MRANVDILEKYIENLVIKKNLLQSSVEAYKLDINEYLSFLENKEKDIFNHFFIFVLNAWHEVFSHAIFYKHE